MTTHHEAPPPPYETSLSDDSDCSTSSDSSATSTELTTPVRDLSLTKDNTTRTDTSDYLRKPIAIPATAPDIGSPFLRAYAPTLETYGISKDVFIKFLDDLNRVAVKNPPLQVLKLVSGFVSYVPEHTTQIVGGAVNAGATLAVVAISKGRTEWALRKANRELFVPRGLKCEVAKLSAVAKLADIPIINERGKIAKHTPLLNHVEDLKEFKGVPSQQRRLNALDPYIAHLEVNEMPAIETPSNPLSRWSLHDSEQQRRKGEAKMVESRFKAHEKFLNRHDRLEKREAKLERKKERIEESGVFDDDPKKKEKRLRKIERKQAKFDAKYEGRVEKAERRRQKRDREEKGMRKILWLVIRNLDAPSGVQEGGENPFVPREGDQDPTMAEIEKSEHQTQRQTHELKA